MARDSGAVVFCHRNLDLRQEQCCISTFPPYTLLPIQGAVNNVWPTDDGKDLLHCDFARILWNDIRLHGTWSSGMC